MMTEKETPKAENTLKVSAPKTSKYEEALSKYNTNLDDNEVREAVKKIITEKVHENDNLDVKRFLMGSIELTTLKTTDSEESVLAFTEKVNEFDEAFGDLPHVATICVYPCFAKVVSETLEVDGVEVACVSGSFPSSQALIEVKVAETALAVKDGATEIDIVMPVGKFLSGDYESIAEDLTEMKDICGSRKLKVILETGALQSAANIKKAAIFAMYCGADFIKTSTGKISVGATPAAVYVMCTAIKDYFDKTGNRTGIKIAGGVKTVEDAVAYYTIVKETLGSEWLTHDLFRIGASSLANTLISDLTDGNANYF